MNLEEAMYIRTSLGEIGKITSIVNNNLDDSGLYGQFYNTKPSVVGKVVKASYNIIDLIEEHDIVETKLDGIVEIFKDNQENLYYELAEHTPSTIYLYEDDIVKFLTHEQFENNCYKVKKD